MTQRAKIDNLFMTQRAKIDTLFMNNILPFKAAPTYTALIKEYGPPGIDPVFLMKLF